MTGPVPDSALVYLRQAARADRRHPVRFLNPDRRWSKRKRPWPVPVYLGDGCYVRERHADDFLSVEVVVELWESHLSAYRREQWHDYLVPLDVVDRQTWALKHDGRWWGLCPSDDPRYQQHACAMCRDPRISIDPEVITEQSRLKRRQGRRPRYV